MADRGTNEILRPPRATRRLDGGATFIELLVSIVLLGIVGVAVLVATTAAIVGARTSDEVAQSQAALAEVADFMTDTDTDKVPYLDCNANSEPDIRSAYQQRIDAVFGAGVVEISEPIEFWNGSAFGSGCAYSSNGERLQRVVLHSVLYDAERSVTVVKRPYNISPTIGTVPAEPIPPYVGGSGQADVTLTDWMVNWP